jgi:hypothetical protein
MGISLDTESGDEPDEQLRRFAERVLGTPAHADDDRHLTIPSAE